MNQNLIQYKKVYYKNKWQNIMKWFKHEAEAHTNMKLQALIDKLGIAGYGYYWACVELIASQGGDGFIIEKDKHWEQHLKKMLNIEQDDQKKYLVELARQNLIDRESLKKGILYIPKLEERCDEYMEKKKRKDKVGIVSGQGRDNVGLEQKRTDKNRKEKKTISYLSKIPEEDMQEFLERFDVSRSKINSKAEDFLFYCKANAKWYADPKSALLNAMKKDFPKVSKKLPFATVTGPIPDRVPIPKDIKDSIQNIIGNKKVN